MRFRLNDLLDNPLGIAEYARAYPEGDPIFEEFHGLREDVESAFSKMKGTDSFNGRLRTYDPTRNEIDKLFWCLFQNVLFEMAVESRLARSHDPPLAA